MEVQDNKREQLLITAYDLKEGDGNRIGVDAYTQCNSPMELKTTSKSGVSTARDLGREHLKKWRQRYWLIATFDKHDQDSGFQHVYFLSPKHLEGWFSKIEAKFDADDLIISKTVKAVEASSFFTEEEQTRVEYMLRRGMLLNDPNIPMTYVREHGIDITFGGANQLVGLIQEFPIVEYVPLTIKKDHPSDVFIRCC